MKNHFNRLRTFVLMFTTTAFFSGALVAQIIPTNVVESKSDVSRATRSDALRAFAFQDSLHYERERAEAIRIAQITGYPVEGKTSDGGSFSLQGLDESGQLKYYSTQNLISAAYLGTTDAWNDYGLSGAGQILQIWDGGRVRTTHTEFDNRVVQVDNSATLDDHATHVAGTMCAYGYNVSASGMAYEAQLRAFDYNNDISEIANEAAGFMLASNHSYGQNAGWRNNPALNRWEWWGNTAISSTEDYKFGFYDEDAQALDYIVYNAPFTLPVWAAGNDRNDVYSGTHWVRNSSNNWVMSSASRDRDGGSDGFDCITPAQTAKNCLTVGAMDIEVSGGLFISGVSDYTSWGPTDDGRIKPDLVARGTDVFSCVASSNSAYDTYSGTSMATPAIAGSMALINEEIDFLFPGSALRASAMRALLIHTADDFTPSNPGPDYQTGWGSMNTLAALDMINDVDERNVWRSRDSLYDGQEVSFLVYHDGNSDLKVTIAWTDPEGPVSPASLNPSTIRLVNDLDVRLIAAWDNNLVYFPWRLNPANPASPATKGDNFRDNVEQILEDNLEPGLYIIRISHKNTLAFGSQVFSTMISGVVDPPSCFGTTTFTTCTGTIEDGSGSDNYANNLDCRWIIAPPGAGALKLTFTGFHTEEGHDFVEVYDGESANDPLLGMFSGTTIPPVLTANSGKAYIHFYTDDSDVQAGWSLNYSCCSAIGTPTVSVNGPTNLCNGESTVLTANNVCSGCTVSWSNGQTGPVITISSAGVYTATVSNNCGQSPASNAITVTTGQTPSAPAITAGGPTSLCAGEIVTLSAGNVCSGCTVSWSNGQTGPIITVLSAGTYTARVSNNCGQSPASNAITVTTGQAPSAPAITAGGPTSLCAGESVTLSAGNVCTGCTVSWSNGQTGGSITVSTAGIYTANVSSACGQSPASNALSVTVEPPFKPVIQVNSTCYLAAPSGNDYQWKLNGVDIPGATGQFWVAAETGYYGVRMQNTVNCPGESDPLFVEKCVSSSTEPESAMHLRLYPNPATDRLFLSVDMPEGVHAVVELFTMEGRLVHRLFEGDFPAGEQTMEWSLPTLPAGVYGCRFTTQGGVLSRPLVIQR